MCLFRWAKPTILGKCELWGLLYRPPFTDDGQIWCAIADPWYTLTCRILSRSIYSVALWRRKTTILPFFELRHLVVSPVGRSLRKLNMAAQLQTFPYPTASKSFLYFNAFVAKSGAQTLTFKSVTNRQRDIQTDRQKTQRFWTPRRRVKSKPHQTWHGDRGPQARCRISITFGGLTHSFAVMGR